MKFLTLAIFLLLFNSVSVAQCDLEHLKQTIDYTHNSVWQIFEWHDTTAQTINTYELQLEKGVSYTVILNSWGGNVNKKFKVSLTDQHQKLKASTYYNRKYYKIMVYKCRRTGLYTLKFEYENSPYFCGIAILGMDK